LVNVWQNKKKFQENSFVFDYDKNLYSNSPLGLLEFENRCLMEVFRTEKYDEVVGNANLPWVNCVMLVRYPLRKNMIQEAIVGFVTQEYEHKILTIVNDG
jgi:hypothetical protein